MRLFRLLLTGSLLVIGLSLGAVPGRAQSAEATTTERFFEETGHSIEGEFRAFWERHGGLAIFGYPISQAFEQDGRET